MASFAFDCSTFAFDYATQRQKTQRQKGRTFSLPPLLLAMLAKAKGKGKSRPTPAGWPDTACLLMRWATFAFASFAFALPFAFAVAKSKAKGSPFASLAFALRAKVALPFAFAVAKSKAKGSQKQRKSKGKAKVQRKSAPLLPLLLPLLA